MIKCKKETTYRVKNSLSLSVSLSLSLSLNRWRLFSLLLNYYFRLSLSVRFFVSSSRIEDESGRFAVEGIFRLILSDSALLSYAE